MWTQHITPITIKAKSVSLLHLLALLVAVLCPAIVQADSNVAPWGPPVVVDPGWGSVGESASMTIVNGNPAISYYDDTNNDLKYVRAADANGTTWGTPITVDSVGIVGAYTSLAVVNGNPAISYSDITNGDLKYVRATDANGATWDTSITVDSTDNVGGATSLTLVDGKPAISYVDSTNSKVKYTRALDTNGITWGTPVVVDNGSYQAWTTSLTIVNGNPAIGYVGSSGYLTYIRAADTDGAAWGTPITMDDTGLIEFLSLAVVGGNPAMSYNTNSGELKYTHAIDANGTAWGTAIIVDSMEMVGGRYNRLAVVDGNPAISYRDSSEGSLKYSRATDSSGMTWVTPITVDSARGRHTNLTVVNGNPAISTYESTNGDLKYVRAEDITGNTWPLLSIVDQGAGSGGMYNSLAVVNGNPAIGYFDELRSGDIDGDLKYVRATDVSGTAWGTPITVDSNGDVGYYPSLVIVGGNPAMSYSGPDGLMYVRASDTNGSIWGGTVIVDGLGGGASSLTVVGGNPAISYSGSGGLKYVQATDASGATWATPIMVDSHGGGNPSMVLVDGKPAIGYSRSELRLSESTIYYELAYVQATDTNGAAWGPPITLDTLTVGLWSRGGLGGNQLAVVNGVPAISYFYNNDDKTGSLKYVQATDTTGTAWASPIIVDSMGNIGSTSLAVIQSNPAISYYDGANGDLRYVRAIDQVGTSWGVPEILDAGKSYGGAFTSLAVVNGQPAISYHGSMRYITIVGVVPITDLWATNSGPTPLGSPTTFSATITAGTDVTYQWDFGDGQRDSGAMPTHTYATAGAYTAIVTATNSLGSVTATTLVNITDMPVSGLHATNSSPTQFGNITTFAATISTGSNVSYVWTFGDGQSGSGATPTHTYAAVGTYTATVTATNNQGSVTATTPVTITDVLISDLHATNSSPTQLGNVTAFTATIGTGTNVAYTWNFGDGQSGRGASTTYTYTAAGAYMATVTATNSLGSVTATIAVTIVDVHRLSILYLPVIRR